MPVAEPTSGSSSRAQRRQAQARARALAAREREREQREAREERKRKRKEQRIASSTHQVARREHGALPGEQSLGYEAGRPVTQQSLRAIVRDERRRAREKAAQLAALPSEEQSALGFDKELIGNYGSDIGEMARGTGPGLLHLGDVLQHDVRELTGAPFRPDLRTLPGRKGDTLDFRAGEEILDPLIENYRYTYLDRGPVIIGQDPETGKTIYRAKDGGETRDPKKARRGIRAKINEHPLGTTFDVLGGLTGGGAVAGKLGQLGLLGKAGRTLYEPGKLTLRTGQGGHIIDKTTSRNPVTRAMQEGIRRLTANIAPKETRFIGEHARAARVGTRQLRRTQRAERMAVVKDFDRALSRLSKVERVAIALRGRGAVPSEEIVAIEKLRDADLAELRALQKKKEKDKADRANIRRLRSQIGDHGALRALIAKVPDEVYHRVLTDPKMREAFEQGERVTEAGGDILKEAGFTFDREARLYLHQRVRSGARFVEPEDIRVPLDEGAVQAERARLSKEIAKSEKRVNDLRVAVAAKRTPKAKARWQEKLRDERERLAFLKRDLAGHRELRGGPLEERIAGGEYVGGTPIEELKDLARRQGEAEEGVTGPREYPQAEDVVDGREVGDHVPNTSSIAASFDDYTELPGIREVPMSDFHVTGRHYSPEGNERIKELADEIEASGKITPLIVAIDEQGPYILEGATRIDALRRLGAKSFPAKVVIDDTPGAGVPRMKYDAERLIFSSDVGAPLREGQIPLIRSGRGKMKDPGIVKQNKATRMLTSRWLPDPRVWKDSFVKSIAYVHAIQRGKYAFDNFGRQVPIDGKIPENGYYVLRPEAWLEKRSNVKVSRADKERPATRDRLNELMDGEISEDDILKGIKGHIASDDTDDAAAWLKDYGNENVRWISKTEYNELFGDFQPANAFVKYVLDKPTDFWRTLTLNYRPAWFVNNFVGQHLLYAMNHATPGGIRAYAESVYNRKRRNDDEFPEVLSASGIYKEEQTQAGGFRAASNLFDRTAEGLGRFNTRWTDDLPRDAAWRDNVRKAKPMIDRVTQTNRTAQQLMRDLKAAGEGKLDDAFLKEQHDLLVQQVFDELIDFSNMSRAERSTLRRVLPFYSWMKGITQATARMGFHNPLKTALLIAVAKEGDRAMEEWFGPNAYDVLKNQFGVKKVGDIATTLSTQGLNPFQTVADNANFVKGLIGVLGEREFYARLRHGDFHGARQVGVDRGLGFGSENPANAFGPVIQAGIEGLTAKDVFTGEEIPAGIYGAGESFVKAFPQTRLATDLLQPQSALTKEGEPRLSQRGTTTIFGVAIPDSMMNYIGYPVKHKSIAGAERVAEDVRLEALPKDKRAVETLNKSFDKKLKEDTALAKKHGLILNQTILGQMRIQHRYQVAARLAEIADPSGKITKTKRAQVFVATLAAENVIKPAVAENLNEVFGRLKRERDIDSLVDQIENRVFFAYHAWLSQKREWGE